MYIYPSIILLLFLFGIVEVLKINIIIRKIVKVLGILIIFIIIGLNRWSYDYSNYINRYFDHLEQKEKGFVGLINLLKKYSPYQGHEVVIFIAGILMVILLIKISKNINLN